MAVDAFLKIDNIDGESEDKAFPKHIEVLSYSWGAAQTGTFQFGGGGGAGKVNFHPFNFSKRLDKASADLMLHCCNGKHVGKALLILRKAGGEQRPYLKVEFSDLLVDSQQFSGAGDSEIPLESISFNFAKIKFSYGTQDAKGNITGWIDKIWDLKKNTGQ
jgi:type VI secretion system secreted protein Hcp